MGAMVMWASETYEMWSRRWRELKTVKTIAEARLLAQREGIPFVIFAKDTLSPEGTPASCISFENNHFWILRSSC
jgi:hypothetical protein